MAAGLATERRSGRRGRLVSVSIKRTAWTPEGKPRPGTARRLCCGLLGATSVDLYSAAFLARCKPMRTRGQATVEEIGLRGVLPGAGDPRIRLLVTDDQAHDGLAALLPVARAGMIRIFGTAARCAQLVADQLAWRCDTVTAMVCSDLRTVPALTLPSDLTLHPVQRLANIEGGGVPLADAVVAAMSAARAIEDPPEVFADFLPLAAANVPPVRCRRQ